MLRGYYLKMTLIRILFFPSKFDIFKDRNEHHKNNHVDYNYTTLDLC